MKLDQHRTVELLERKHSTGSMPLLTPNHSYRTCGGGKAITSTTVLEKRGVITGLGIRNAENPLGAALPSYYTDLLFLNIDNPRQVTVVDIDNPRQVTVVDIDNPRQVTVVDIDNPRQVTVVDIDNPRQVTVVDIDNPRQVTVVDIDNPRQVTVVDIDNPRQVTVVDIDNPRQVTVVDMGIVVWIYWILIC